MILVDGPTLFSAHLLDLPLQTPWEIQEILGFKILRSLFHRPEDLVQLLCPIKSCGTGAAVFQIPLTSMVVVVVVLNGGRAPCKGFFKLSSMQNKMAPDVSLQ